MLKRQNVCKHSLRSNEEIGERGWKKARERIQAEVIHYSLYVIIIMLY